MAQNLFDNAKFGDMLLTEEINKDGDVNPAVYGDSLKDVMNKLKSVL